MSVPGAASKALIKHKHVRNEELDQKANILFFDQQGNKNKSRSLPHGQSVADLSPCCDL